MFARFQLILLTLVSIGVSEGSAICNEGSYLNLCGVCVGRTTDRNELDGLDRCNICGGKSDCVGCDGIINSPRRRDSCGLCLLPQAEEWNDCLIIDNIYPSLLDLSLDNGLVPLLISGAGLKQSYLNTTQCLIQPLESQSDGPTVKEISLDENNIQIMVELTQSTGAYRIGCSEIEGFVELYIVDSGKLNAVGVEPSEVEVDKKVEVEIEVDKDVSSNITVWCFVREGPGAVTTLPAARKTDKLFKCSEYTPLTPGVVKVGIVANEDTAYRENRTGKVVELFVRAKPPIAETAEYTPDFQQIAVRFDQNIEISDCDGTFTPDTEKYLGKGFACTSSGDVLLVTLGNESEITESITITSKNKIRRSQKANAQLSPNAAATTLLLSKGKMRTPTISLSLPNVVCADKTKQPVINVAVTKLGEQKTSYIWTVPPLKGWKGKNQRENMLMWKNVRAVEAELSNSSRPDGLVLSRENLLPGIKYDINLRSRGLPANDVTASFTISENENVSVTVKAFPSASAIVAEVSIISCDDAVTQQILRYKWFVDDKLVHADGRLLFIPQADPGSHDISCVVYSHESGQVLGRGWTVAEVVTLPEQTVIFPTEIAVGTMDDITIQAYSRENRWQWSCATELGEPCITVGPKSRPIDEVVDVTSSTIRIPAGALPIGKYIWTLHGNKESTATVIISPRIPPIIKVVPPIPIVDATKPLKLNAEVERLKSGCKMQWKVMRRKGYDYFNLQDNVGLGDLMKVRKDDLIMEEREVPLVVPVARGDWKGLAGGATYLFRLEAVCSDPVTESHADVTVIANAPPKASSIFISPNTGEAVNTKFTVQLAEGTDDMEDYPLFHHLSLRDETDDEILLATSVSNKFDVYLTPGNITLTVKSCDIHGSCSTSSKSITVKEPSDVTTEDIKNLGHEIRSSMLCGDSTTAYGTIITTLKTLSAKPEFKEKLDEITSVAESALKERLQDLSERLRSEPNVMKHSFEFLQQSVGSLKYFPETKDMVKVLTEFKNLLTQYPGLKRLKRRERVEDLPVRRIKRETDKELSIVKVNEGTIKAIFDLHAKILEQNNTKESREEFLKDVRKYMIDMCAAVQDFVQSPISINSSIVTLEVIKLNPNELKNDISLSSMANTKVRFNLKQGSRKTCAAFAKYDADYMESTTTTRGSDVFEVRLIKNGTFKEDDIKSVSVTMPVSSQENVSCMAWSDGWSSVCNLKAKTETTVSCSCKNTGIFAVFLNNKTVEKMTTLGITTTTAAPTTTVTVKVENTSVGEIPTSMSSPNTTTVSTTITTTTASTTITTTSLQTTTISTTTTTQNVTTITAQNLSSTTATTETLVLTSAGSTGNTDTVRDRNISLYITGTFKINEDFDEVVGKNTTGFKESVRRQLAEQLKVSTAVIANLLIRPGSIIVTVMFVDSQDFIAEAAVKELIARLHDGNLKLIGPNAKVLNIPPQDLKVKISTNSAKNTGKMRLIAYGVVAGTFITIFLFAFGAAYLKRKRTRIPLRLPHLSIDDHPTYRQFHNEFSLDGSSASLARYRQNHPFETESTQ
ncbi:UNVERIFIED_CONTAM: hypothetical protein PYX00_003257 [Menopon gallinae]|uniref:PKD/REJ-like domain-containing protein n=1 Tax=Menopon gallinae TaxID=328185 RepID=A0AAW2I114_9NEOP